MFVFCRLWKSLESVQTGFNLVITLFFYNTGVCVCACVRACVCVWEREREREREGGRERGVCVQADISLWCLCEVRFLKGDARKPTLMFLTPGPCVSRTPSSSSSSSSSSFWSPRSIAKRCIVETKKKHVTETHNQWPNNVLLKKKKKTCNWTKKKNLFLNKCQITPW